MTRWAEKERAERELQAAKERAERELRAAKERAERELRAAKERAERELQAAERTAAREARRAEIDHRSAARAAEREAHRVALGLEVAARGAHRSGRHARDQARALTRERIVREAVEIARREGADAVSMRRVADALRVGAMSLYWHVPNKDDLVRAMQELVFDEMGIDGPPTGDWRADLTRIATATRASLERNGWMNAFAHRRPRMSPALMRHGEASIASVDGLGLTLAEMVAIVTAVDDYVIGFVTRRQREPGESSDRASLDDGPDVWADPEVRAALASGDFPIFARHAGQPWQTSADDRFAFGLGCLLDGIERFLVRRAAETAGGPVPGPVEPTS